MNDQAFGKGLAGKILLLTEEWKQLSKTSNAGSYWSVCSDYSYA